MMMPNKALELREKSCTKRAGKKTRRKIKPGGRLNQETVKCLYRLVGMTLSLNRDIPTRVDNGSFLWCDFTL